MKLTNHELSLLADSVHWELGFMQSKGWDLSLRYKTLQALQKKVYAFVDEQEGDPNWKPVTRHTRASASGRLIKCPHCGHENRVYHFSWCAVTCQGCRRMVDKYDFTTPAK
jgi:hypothetical protein